MGTRSIIQFSQGYDKIQVYRHWDGYLSGVIPELEEFLKWNGIRNDDLSYMVANFVTWSKIKGQLHRCESNKKFNADQAKKDPNHYPTTFDRAFKNPDSNMGSLHTGFGIQPHLCTYDDLKDDIFIEFFYKVEIHESGNVSVKAYANTSDGLEELGDFTFWGKRQELVDNQNGKSAEVFCIDYDNKKDAEYKKQEELEAKVKA